MTPTVFICAGHFVVICKRRAHHQGVLHAGLALSAMRTDGTTCALLTPIVPVRSFAAIACAGHEEAICHSACRTVWQCEQSVAPPANINTALSTHILVSTLCC